MTQIAFHFGAPDKIHYACRLLRKAVSRGNRVLVVADTQTCAKLDDALWAISPTDFVAHAWARGTGSLVQRAYVGLTDEPSLGEVQWPILVNLGASVPTGFEKFPRLIEVVSTDSSDRALARQRWKHYAASGYTMERHDLNLQVNPGA